MRTYGHRRQIVLFLVAILLPCVVLIALALRMIRQERELAEKRLAEQQHLLTSESRQELLASLEKIKLQEVSALAKQTGGTPPVAYTNPAVALVAWVEDNRLVLPWEKQRASEEFKRLLGEAEFVKKLAQGERAEVEAKQIVRAAESYRQALDAARHPAQKAYARLLLARVLSKSGHDIEAHAEYRKVLTLPSDMVDEHGVPFALYAAARLLEAGREQERVLQRVRAEVNAPMVAADRGLPAAKPFRVTGQEECRYQPPCCCPGSTAKNSQVP